MLKALSVTRVRYNIFSKKKMLKKLIKDIYCLIKLLRSCHLQQSQMKLPLRSFE